MELAVDLDLARFFRMRGCRELVECLYIATLHCLSVIDAHINVLYMKNQEEQRKTSVDGRV